MCGIFGRFGERVQTDSIAADVMGNAILHRGPDGHGAYHGQFGFIGNQRLAIIDPEGGDQPFVSNDGKVGVVQNGAIFNYIELRAKYEKLGFQFKSRCDTEVILAGYLLLGRACVHDFNGMFAIAIYDSRTNETHLIRDRLGEKPLYLAQKDSNYWFASEIKSILSIETFDAIDEEALANYFSFNYVPAPLSINKGIQHIAPGTWTTLNSKGAKTETYWSINQLQQENWTEPEAKARLNEILADAVHLRTRADVPFGAFLSGGIDSSSVVGLMSQMLSSPVQTFCIGFDDARYDESPYAAMAATRFGAQHQCEIVSPNLLDEWSNVLWHTDGPHGDASFMPTLAVSKLAARSVKMVLTGDGADELFAGYEKYSGIFQSLPDQHSFPTHLSSALSLFKPKELSALLNFDVQGATVFDRIKPMLTAVDHMDPINQMLAVDTQLLLPGNNLVKPDRMGMAVSIENRAPFLDFRMAEFAFSLPGDMKLKGIEKKYIYKEAVKGLIGAELAYRKKQMFTVPIGDWFKSSLRDWCNEILFDGQLAGRGLLNMDFVRRLFTEHMNDKINRTRELRAIIAFEVWARTRVE